jgi:hypothetical protein
MGHCSNYDLPGWAAVATAAQPVPLMPAELDQPVCPDRPCIPIRCSPQVLTASTRWNEIREAAGCTGNGYLCARLAAVSFGARHDATTRSGVDRTTQRRGAHAAPGGDGRISECAAGSLKNTASCNLTPTLRDPCMGWRSAARFISAQRLQSTRRAPMGLRKLALLWPSHAIVIHRAPWDRLGKPRRLPYGLRPAERRSHVAMEPQPMMRHAGPAKCVLAAGPRPTATSRCLQRRNRELEGGAVTLIW